MGRTGFNGAAMSSARTVAQARGNVPILKLLLGGVLLFFWCLALMLQIQTSEAFILNGPVVGLLPNWQILMQPVALIQGGISVNTGKAIIWGWGIELIYLACVIGEISMQGRWRNIFMTGAGVLVLFDFWTDLNYGSMPSGIGGQIAFAGITAFMVAFFGVLGLNLIFSAIMEIA